MEQGRAHRLALLWGVAAGCVYPTAFPLPWGSFVFFEDTALK